MKLVRITLAGLMALVLVACSTTKVDPYLGNSPDYIYAKGHTLLQKGAFDDATTAYQSLDTQYPFNPFTQKGDLDMIYAQYQADNPALAIAAANRYVRMYPNDAHLDYAYYMRGVVEFDNGRSFLERHTPYDMSQHNADGYQNAYQDLNTVVTQYPTSPYMTDARRRMMYLVNTMAQFQLNVATYDYEMTEYVGAINRATIVLINYPQTPALQGALEVMVNSYQALGLTELAQSSLAMLKMNFPHNPLLKDKNIAS